MIDRQWVMFIESGQIRLSHFARTPLPDPNWPQVISRAEFDLASESITQWPGYQPTPLHSLQALASHIGVGSIHYKDESKRIGVSSFKALGAPYAASRVLHEALNQAGVNTSIEDVAAGKNQADCAALTVASATDGNHGRALAWGANRFGANCQITIHADVSPFREQAMSDLGAIVTRIDGDYDESVRVAREQAEKNGWYVVSDTSWPGYTQTPMHVMAGYGVMIDEIIAQTSEPPTHVFVQGGVGGLAAAVCARLTQRYDNADIRFIMVEPEWAACLQASARNETMTTVQIEQETMMAGLSCGEPSQIAWQVLSALATDFTTIADDSVAPCMRLLARPTGNDPAIVAGESAVAGLAALFGAMADQTVSAAMNLDQSSRVLLFGTEGNTDPQIYEQVMKAA